VSLMLIRTRIGLDTFLGPEAVIRIQAGGVIEAKTLLRTKNVKAATCESCISDKGVHTIYYNLTRDTKVLYSVFSTAKDTLFTVHNPDFGTFRAFLASQTEETLEGTFNTLKSFVQDTCLFDSDDMIPLREYVVSWLVSTFRHILTKEFKK